MPDRTLVQIYANKRMRATTFSVLIIAYRSVPAIVTVTFDVIAIRVEVEIYEHNYAKSVNDVV